MAEEQEVTIQDIADRARVSISTVSRVLRGSAPVSEAKREAVLKAVAELNYQPNIFAQGLASGQSRTIGVLTQNVSSPLYDVLLRGVLQGLRGSGYSPLFADGYWEPAREMKALQILLGRRVDGLIILGGATPEERLCEIARQLPLVVAGRSVASMPERCLTFDNFGGAYRATQYLIEFGHRRIAHLTGLLQHEDAAHRLEGYMQALRDHDLPVDEGLVVEGDFQERSGVIAVESLLSQGRPFTALFAANDQMAYGARLALYRRGIRVPEDVSLVGFDDQAPSAYTTPPLTTIRQPAIEIGQAAAGALLQLLEGKSSEMPHFAAELIVRESVTWHGR